MPNPVNPSNYMGYPQPQPMPMMPGYGAPPMMGAPMGYPMMGQPMMPPIMFPISQQAAEEGYYAQMAPPVMPQVQVRGGQPSPTGPVPVNFTNPQAPQAQPVQAPPMIPTPEIIPTGPMPPITPQPADDKENVLNEIDNLLSQLTIMKDMASTDVEYGQPRFGVESLKGRSHKQLIEDCLNKAISIYPGVTYNLFLNAYNMYDLTIFFNNRLVDRFLVDPYFKYGKGCPVLFGKLAGPNNGNPEDQKQSPGNTCIPLGCTLAIRQNVFRNVPAEPGYGKNFIGTTTDVYYEICTHMLSQQAYYLLDLTSVDFPDDEAQYLEFGAKVEAINNKYPLKSRFRVYNYVDNDNFILISDNLVKPYSVTTDKRKPVNTFIQVSGNTLNITEPNDKKITIEL